MIYSINNEPLVLTREVADEFLEAVGVELFDDEISINGTLYEGTYGESILEENGIFLYEDSIVLEGKTKKEYEIEKNERRIAKDLEDNRSITRSWVRATAKAGYSNSVNDRYNREAKNRRKSETDSVEEYRDDARKFADKWNAKKADVWKKYPKDGIDGLRKDNREAADSMEAEFNSDRSRHISLSDKAKNNARNRLNFTLNDKDRVLSSIDKHERRQAKKYGKKKSTNESTIFSDIEII